MPFFREGFRLTERDRQELLRSADASDPYARAMIEHIFDDVYELINAANVVPERMICQLLFPADGNVGISIQANGVDYTYNYDAEGTWKENNFMALTGNQLWSAATTADPFANFKTAMDAARVRTGTELTTAVMNTNTFNLMAKTSALKERFLSASGAARAFLSDDEVRAVVKNTSRLQIALYDRMYRDEDRAAHAFVPDGYVCLIPDGALGATWYGTTPEEADLAASSADVAIVNTGVAISRVVEEHPVNINTFASEIVLPSYERMDEVVVMKVCA